MQPPVSPCLPQLSSQPQTMSVDDQGSHKAAQNSIDQGWESYYKKG
jgi:hypothetical protein